MKYLVKKPLNLVLLAFLLPQVACAQAIGHIDTSLEECPTMYSVYVYSTPRAKTQKPLGFLGDRTKINITLKPRVAAYYLVDGDNGETHLHGYVQKQCVMIDELPLEEVEAEAPPEPVLHSGTIRVFPLNLGDKFGVTIGSDTGTCTAKSTKDLECPLPLPGFQAVIASQGGHEFLLGCQWQDSDTCVSLGVGLYSILVHDRTVTILHSGWVTLNTKTGKKIADITPVFTVLTFVK